WNMGWMHDTLQYFYHQDHGRASRKDIITNCLSYAFYENFLLPLSHDEVVHEKSSLLGKMPGRDEEKFAHLRCLFAYMYAHPGKKLLFMGSEIAQWTEWNHEGELEWELLKYDRHKAIQTLIKDLNVFYKKEKAFCGEDFSHDHFRWVNCQDRRHGVISFLRLAKQKKDQILVVCNFKNRYSKRRIGVPVSGEWKIVFSTDRKRYGGRDRVPETVCSKKKSSDRYPDSIEVEIPPLSILYFKHV
ncbi:MAG: alpha amylase C-terminal domain-containing protein, partial [Candidatus Omnitrophica bacterium]|nr:alpha amylase C-terminal domain-containing protein [Candidatus Omnitrophota bacterium]